LIRAATIKNDYGTELCSAG